MPSFLKLAVVSSLISAHLCAGAQRQAPGGRLRPPQQVECPRDNLTSFTGKIVSYSRSDERIVIGMRTDEDTSEKFTLEFSKQDDPTKWFLLRGEPFPEGGWDAVESSTGRLHPDMRATVWICEGSDNKPIVDWQPPPPGNNN